MTMSLVFPAVRALRVDVNDGTDTALCSGESLMITTCKVPFGRNMAPLVSV